jgi:hypothetical protein
MSSVFARGAERWQDAAPTTAMTHIAIQEALNGKAVGWMNHIADEEYLRKA